MANATKVDVTTAFNAGEFTPALAGRIDFQDYKYSARFIENFIPEVQGGLKKFYGTRKIAVIAKPSDYVMVPFNGLDRPVVLIVHDGIVSVIDGDDYYDTSLRVAAAGLKSLQWAQQNAVMYFAHPDVPPFEIRCYGRGDDNKLIFTINEIGFIDVPYFPVGWNGNFNGVITTSAETGVITVSSVTTAVLRLKLPDVITSTSGVINVLSQNADMTQTVVSKVGSTNYSATTGTTHIRLIRKRNGVETVVSSFTSGVEQTVTGWNYVHSGGVSLWQTKTLKYKTLSVQNILSSMLGVYPTAVVSGNYIVIDGAIPGHQAGDEYALRILQNQSTSTYPNTGTSSNAPSSVPGDHFLYHYKPLYNTWTEDGEFSEPVSSSDEFTDVNMVGRKIKFQIESNRTTKAWASGISVTAGEIYFSDYNYYIAASSGTTGTTQPIHHQGRASDGAVDWEYFHSGFGTATVVEVQDSQHLTAVVDGYLPVLQTGLSSYTWKQYQWSMWGYHGKYPSQVFFFKGRLCYFTPTDGYGCWFQASKTDDFYDFGTQTYGQVLDTCAINQLVTGHDDNNINWLLSGDRLYCGSYAGEYNIYGSDGTISPAGCIIDPVTSIGGAPVKALRFSGLNLFVGRLSNEIYTIQYDYTTDDYAPDNIGFMSSHLLNEKVRRWESLRNADRNIYFNTKQDNVRIINYVKEMKNLGYFRLNLGAPVLDLAASDAGPVSALYFMVERPTGCFLERAASEEPNYMLAETRTELESLEPVTFADYAGLQVWVKNNENGQFYETRIGNAGEFDNVHNWLNFSIGFSMMCIIHGQPPAGEKLEGLQQKAVRFIVRLREAGDFSYGSSVDFNKIYHYNDWNILNTQEWNGAHKTITGDVQLPSSFGYTVGQNKGSGPYPNDTGIALNIYANTPEPFTLLSVSNIYV